MKSFSLRFHQKILLTGIFFLFLSLNKVLIPFAFAEEKTKTPVVPTAAPAAKTPEPAPSSISVKAEIDRAFLTIGDPVTYTVTIRHEPGVQILSSIQSPDASILKIKKTQDFQRKEGKLQVSGKKFTLTSFRLGEFVLDPQTIEYRAGNNPSQKISTDKIYLTVKSVAEGEDKKDIKGIKGVIEMFLSLKGLWIAVTIIIFLMAAVIFFYLHRKGALANLIPSKPKLPPDAEALLRLNQLQDSDLLRSGKIKEYFFQLSEILKTYFELRYGIQALESTTDEILNLLKKRNVDMKLREKILQVMETADLAKFAKWKPEPPVILQTFQGAKEVIEISKPSAIHVPGEEGGKPV